MNASMQRRSLASAASNTASTSSGLALIGFSPRSGLPPPSARIGQQRLVAAEGVRDAVLPGVCVRARLVARCDGDDLGVLALCRALEQPPVDARGREDP